MKVSVAVSGADTSLVARLTAAAGMKLAPLLARHGAAGRGIGHSAEATLSSASRADDAPSLRDDSAITSPAEEVPPSPDI